VYATESGPAAGAAPTVKTAPGEKTVKAPKARTFPASPPAEKKKETESDSGPLEFNFDQPLLPADEDMRATQRGAAAEPTERLDATVVAGKPEKAGKPASSKPAASEKPAAGKPAAEKSSDEKVSKWDEETDDEKDSSSSDDDLNDFLQSLGDKGK
jgi:hypothetical protein